MELPTPYGAAMLRTARSAPADAVRDSGALRTEVTLSFMGTALPLDVVDDG